MFLPSLMCVTLHLFCSPTSAPLPWGKGPS